MAYRGPFDGFHASEVSVSKTCLVPVSKTCLVRFDNNQYSVAARAVGRPVDMRGLCCKPDVGVSQIRTTTVLSSCFCVGQTVL